MKTATLYLYTIFAILAAIAIADYQTEIDEDLYAARLAAGPDDKMQTDAEFHKFNERLDATVEKVNKIYNEELKLAKLKKPNLTDLEASRIYLKISHKIFRNYGNFSTLADGTFFGDMFAIPDDYYENDL